MLVRRVRVASACRLHFGLVALGQSEGREYGGVGLMLAPPETVVEVEPAPTFRVEGPDAPRAEQWARQVAAAVCENVPRGVSLPAEELGLRLRTVAVPPAHVGLGSGTQLALAVAAAVETALVGRRRPAVELARLVGRGARSAIGIHGFDHGGLVVEPGKLPGEEIAPLTEAVRLPAAWRFVLVVPAAAAGLSGREERAAFAALGSIPRATSDALWRIATDELLPAARAGDFAGFARALGRYGHLAGTCFAPIQGGPYRAGPTADWVEWFARQGVEGAGQTSWGPAVWAAAPDDATAHALAAAVRREADDPRTACFVATPAAEQARVEVLD